MGRPSKCTPDRKQRIIEALEDGNTRRAACQYAGIDQDTLSRWCARFTDFADRAREAEATAEIRAVSIIRHGIDSGDTADAKWWLERRRPEDYARRDKVDLEVYVRQRARELGLDEDEALEVLKPRLRLVS